METGLSFGHGESVCAPTTMNPAFSGSTAPPTANAIKDEPLRLQTEKEAENEEYKEGDDEEKNRGGVLSRQKHLKRQQRAQAPWLRFKRIDRF